jgi:hypothetical protein
MAQKILPIIGSVWGRLTVLEEAEPLTYPDYRRNSTYEKPRVLCSCNCDGKRVIVRVDALRGGRVRSCGCLHRESARERMTAMDKRGNKHRQTHGGSYTPEFYVWRTMKARCTNPKNRQFHRYGGRGIKVCRRWLNSFENFLLDMGNRPSPKHTIDRIDNDGNYEPSNCKWSTQHEQNTNRSSNVFLTYQGETLCQADWARRFGMNRVLINRRLRDGWSVDETLTTPPIPRGLRGIRRRK